MGSIDISTEKVVDRDKDRENRVEQPNVETPDTLGWLAVVIMSLAGGLLIWSLFSGKAA